MDEDVKLFSNGAGQQQEFGKKGGFPDPAGEEQGYKLSRGKIEREPHRTQEGFFFHDNNASLHQSEASDVRLVCGRGRRRGRV